MINAIIKFLDSCGWKLSVRAVIDGGKLLFLRNLNPGDNPIKNKWTLNVTSNPISHLLYMQYALDMRKEDILLNLIPYLFESGYSVESLFEVVTRRFKDYGWHHIPREHYFEIHPKGGVTEILILPDGDMDYLREAVRNLANVRERAVWKVLKEIMEEWTDVVPSNKEST